MNSQREKTIEAVAKVLPYRNAVAAARVIEALPLGTFADEVEKPDRSITETLGMDRDK